MSNAQLSCGSCLVVLDKASFYRKQRKRGRYARCPRCASRNAPFHPRIAVDIRKEQERSELEYRLRKQEWKRKQRAQEQARLDHPVAPPHPDHGKVFSPSQSFEVKSGGFCFGLRHQAQESAQVRLMTFQDITRYTHHIDRIKRWRRTINISWCSRWL